MNEERHSPLGRRLMAAGAACVAAAGVFAAIGLAEELPGSTETPTDTTGTATGAAETTSGTDGKKAFVCHKGRRTIHISVNAVPAHLRHGDLVGECAEQVAKRAARAARRAAKKAARQALALPAAGQATVAAGADAAPSTATGKGGGNGKSKGGGKHGG